MHVLLFGGVITSYLESQSHCRGLHMHQQTTCFMQKFGVTAIQKCIPFYRTSLCKVKACGRLPLQCELALVQIACDNSPDCCIDDAIYATWSLCNRNWLDHDLLLLLSAVAWSLHQITLNLSAWAVWWNPQLVISSTTGMHCAAPGTAFFFISMPFLDT